MVIFEFEFGVELVIVFEVVFVVEMFQIPFGFVVVIIYFKVEFLVEKMVSEFVVAYFVEINYFRLHLIM